VLNIAAGTRASGSAVATGQAAGHGDEMGPLHSQPFCLRAASPLAPAPPPLRSRLRREALGCPCYNDRGVQVFPQEV
jgi:hypothetical protein